MSFLNSGHLDFSHLTELKNVYFTGIYMKTNTNYQELTIIKLRKKIFFDGIPLKGCVAS